MNHVAWNRTIIGLSRCSSSPIMWSLQYCRTKPTKTTPSNTPRWLVRATKVFIFPPSCQLCPAACLLLWRNPILHLIKSSKWSHVFAVWLLYSKSFAFFFISRFTKKENHRCVQCLSQSANNMKDGGGDVRTSLGNNDKSLVVILVLSDRLTHPGSDKHSGLFLQKP